MGARGSERAGGVARFYCFLSCLDRRTCHKISGSRTKKFHLEPKKKFLCGEKTLARIPTDVVSARLSHWNTAIESAYFMNYPGKEFPARCLVRGVSRQVLLCPGDLAETCEANTQTSRNYSRLMVAEQLLSSHLNIWGDS